MARRRWRGSALAAAGVLAVVTALANPASAAAANLPRATQPIPAPPSSSLATPTIPWRACATAEAPTLQCGTLAVPFDYAKPFGPKFTLAVSKLPATGAPTGTLFFNPGGPGGAGAKVVPYLAAVVPPSVRERFDIVGWDPRGLGDTKPTLQDCPYLGLTLPTSGPVDWVAARARSESAVAAANRTCMTRNAGFINYVGTTNVARDLDRLREAVGDDKVTYWGMSYGTRIGYVYAILFPTRIRAMVLDGNIDPTGTYAGLAQGGVALDSALTFMRTANPATHKSIMDTLQGLDAAPIDVGGGARYTRWDYLTTMSGVIPSEESWPQIKGFNNVIATARLTTPEGLQARATLRTQIGRTDHNLGGAFGVVNCLDYADRMTPAAQEAAIKRNATDGPVFGGLITSEYVLGCTGLTVRPDPVPTTSSRANLARIASLP
ncbi:MAG: hypothetical protein RLZ55_719, partial [Actinomycetota bacterium]